MTSREQKALAAEGTMSTSASTPLSFDTCFEEILPHATEPQTSCRTLHPRLADLGNLNSSPNSVTSVHKAQGATSNANFKTAFCRLENY